MDLTTLLGLLAMAVLIIRGATSGEISNTFLNWHGLGVVLGGTGAAILINTPGRYVLESLRAFVSLIRSSPYRRPEDSIPLMVSLAEQAQGRGISALRDVDARAAEGFLSRAAQVALEHNDPVFVREVLEQEVNQNYDTQNEVINVFRSMGVLSPMFGLVGTLIGIVNVLKEISNPEAVGAAMAVAITSAFYGILMANMVCVPVAGKLRIRSWQEVTTKSIILEGVLLIMQGTVPIVVERKLQSFLSSQR
jgi:chemotaxis protein MotA